MKARGHRAGEDRMKFSVDVSQRRRLSRGQEGKGAPWQGLDTHGKKGEVSVGKRWLLERRVEETYQGNAEGSWSGQRM